MSTPGFGQSLACGRAAVAPVLDGQPEDACWREAMVATDFSVLGSGGTERAFRQTTVRAAWDDTALYLHAILLEPDPQSITANVTERDGRVWLEDALEVFLQPDPAQPDTFHFIVNARGVLYDERNTDGTWNSSAEVQVAIGEQAWQVEMAVPWRDLPRMPHVGDEWGFNLGREHRPQEPLEWSTWAPLRPGEVRFAQPELFGRLRFTAKPEPGRASKLNLPAGLVVNPDFTQLADGQPAGWTLPAGSAFGEIVPLSQHYAVRNAADYGIASQPLDVPVQAGDLFTVFTVMRGGDGATGGVAVVQEMADGRPDDLYPYWNRELTPDFRLYVGRIVVDQGARRLSSLRLYRANRRGWVEYAYCQVVPGAHRLSGIMEAENCTSSEERGLGEPWATPALSAFRPLPGGPIRALIFIGEFQRDAVELAQRLDLDYDLVYGPTFRGSGKVDQVVAFGAAKVLGKLGRGEYDLIVLAGQPSDPAVIDALLRAVEAGTGLVAVEPLTGGGAAHPEELDRLRALLPTEALVADRFRAVCGVLDPDVLEQTSHGQPVLKAVAAREWGPSRLVRLTWSEGVPGLIPFVPGTGQWWEYRWAVLARACLWAARREPVPRIEALDCSDRLAIRVGAADGAPLELAVEWDTPFGVLPGERVRVAGRAGTRPAPTDGGTSVSVPVEPGLRRRRGPHVGRVLLLKDGRPVDFAACVVPGAEPRLRIESVEVPLTVQPNESVAVHIRYAATAAGILRTELVDAFGRVTARAEVPAAPGDGQEAQVPLTLRDPLSVYHRVVVSALDGGELADRQERDLFVPAATPPGPPPAGGHLDEFRLGVGYAAMHVRCPEYLYDSLVGFLRAHGVEAATVNEYMIQRGLPAFGGTVGAGMGYGGTSNVRHPSFSDPAQVQAMVQRTVEGIGKKWHWGFFGFNMDDEVHLHQSASVEVDASEPARRAFRQWVQEEYGTIERVNAEWGTAYPGFEDIEIPLLAAMKGATNPARWVDFRLFMEREWANAYAAAHRAVREAYPDVNLSFTNPHKYNSLSGTDFARWAPHEEIQLRYCHRHVLDRIRSWSDAPILSWFGYHSRAAECGYFVWNLALNGGACAFWWNPLEPWAYSGQEGFTPWYLFDPLWRETQRSRAVTRAARALQWGLGKLLRVAAPEPPEALILHSQPSLHVLYAEAALPIGQPTDAGYDRYAASDEAMALALIRRGFQYRYVRPEALTPERLQGVKLLALPSCVALSDDTVAALRRFVADGGKLLADLLPATHDEHGKPRAAGPPLADLFQGRQAVCLNASADADAAAELDQALTRLEVAAAIRWRTAGNPLGGRLPAYTRLYAYRLGTARFLGILRDPRPEAAQDGSLTLDLPEERFVYDCRAGKALGQRRTLTVDVPVGEAQVFALLPYQPAGLKVQVAVDGRQLGVRAALEAPSPPTDHVFHLEVTPPGHAEPARHYTQNVVGKGGQAEVVVPLALNDPEGVWRVEVTDVASGLRATAPASVAGSG